MPSNTPTPANLRFLHTANTTHVASYTQLYMDAALQRAGLPSITNPTSSTTLSFTRLLARLGIPRNLHASSLGPVISNMMGPSETHLFPLALWTEIIPYCFDVWPSNYDRWASFFRRYRIRTAFFSARQAAAHFQLTSPRMRCIWLPEATDPAAYNPTIPWQDRTIDVLELGRKFDAYHDAITPALATAGKVHLYEKVKGQIVFPDQAALVEGFAHSRISICFPSSRTHPERSGEIETVTHRYFESMSSRCLIVGHAPAELVDLFGYNPVIEAEPDNEAAQLLHILANPAAVQPLIDRNYQRMLEVGNYDARIATMLHHLRPI